MGSLVALEVGGLADWLKQNNPPGFRHQGSQPTSDNKIVSHLSVPPSTGDPVWSNWRTPWSKSRDLLPGPVLGRSQGLCTWITFVNIIYSKVPSFCSRPLEIYMFKVFSSVNIYFCFVSLMMSELELQFLHFKNLKLCKILGKVQIQIEATILLRRMGITKNWRWTGDFRNNTDTDTQGYDEIFQCTFTLELDNSFL